MAAVATSLRKLFLHQPTIQQHLLTENHLYLTWVWVACVGYGLEVVGGTPTLISVWWAIDANDNDIDNTCCGRAVEYAD